MPYIGPPAPDRFVAPKAATQFSGDGSTTAFTLDHAVGSDEDILVSVDGVIQEPSVAYAVSNGTTLTFTAAPSSNSGNNIFVYYLFRTVATVDHPSTSALTATSGTFTGNATVSGTLGVTGTQTNNGNFVVSKATPNVDIKDTGTAQASMDFLSNSDTVRATIGMERSAGGGLFVGSSAYAAVFGTASSGNTEFATNNNIQMKIDSTGAVTMPNQPAFNVGGIDGTQDNITVGSLVTVKYDTERFDLGSDFDTSNYTFTAPVTGKYYLHAQVYVNTIDSSATYYSLRIDTSNKDYISIYNYTHSDLNYITFQIDVLADMDASDTATVGVLQPDGTSQTDIVDNTSYTFFCGHLVA